MDKPIRILHILQRMEAGGTQALLMNLYRNIDRNKIQFDFLVEYPNKQFYDDEIKKLGGKIFYTNVRNDYNIFKFKKEIKKIINENNYKIVHVHAYTIGYFALKAAKECGVPVRIAHSHSNSMTNDMKKPLKKILQKLFLVHATDFMACSQEAGRYLFNNKKFEILNNAIDSKKFIFNNNTRDKIRKELNINDSFVVGHVGRLKIEKNHKFIINVFKKIKDEKENSKLIFIGDGPYKKQILDFVKKENLEEDVMVLGNKNNINEYLQAMDIFIFPSKYEGLGIAAIESQAAGTPIIISNGVPDETIISPICFKMSLEEDSYEEWAKKAINLSSSELSHSNMQKYVVEAGFDLKSTVNRIQEYYIKSYKED